MRRYTKSSKVLLRAAHGISAKIHSDPPDATAGHSDVPRPAVAACDASVLSTLVGVAIAVALMFEADRARSCAIESKKPLIFPAAVEPFLCRRAQPWCDAAAISRGMRSRSITLRIASDQSRAARAGRRV